MGYQLIERIEVGSGGAASIEFTGIDQTGQDLVVLLSLRNADGFGQVTANWKLQLNSTNTGAKKSLWGTAVSSQSYSSSEEINGLNASASTGSTFSSHKISLPNYTSAANKSISIDNVSENNATEGYQVITAGLWANTAAITSVKILAENGTLVQYSTASLYKITAD